MNPAISIIVVTHNRVKLLKRCLTSIAESDLPAGSELIVIINGTDAESAGFLKSFSTNKADLRFYHIEHSTSGRAHNEGIRRSAGDMLYFLDDDITVEKNIFTEVFKKRVRYPDVYIFGGPNLTPPGSTLFQRCCGYVLSSAFGSAKMRNRYIKGPREKFVDDTSLILCNLAISRKIFEDEKMLMNENFSCNEENLLLQELRQKGYGMLYSPDLIVYHNRREGVKNFFWQIFNYGKGRMRQTLCSPKLFLPFTVIPSLFVLYLVSLGLFRSMVYLLPFFAYAAIDVFCAASLSLKYRNPMIFLYTFILFPVQHIAYGLGFILGFRPSYIGD